MIIKEYAIVLTQIMNYRWAQLLEQFNRSPRIVSKVQGSMNNQIRRKNLAKYKEILLKQFKNGLIKDFYTGETIESNDISIDHVIPWSFMYSDDLWNLVITSKSNNSKKSNNIPNEEVINKLKQRNESLLELLNDEKSKIELRNAIELDYVTKFYYDAII